MILPRAKGGDPRPGEPESIVTDETTGATTVRFPSGISRVYSRAEIAAYVADLAEQIVNDPGSVSEPWHEFLARVVGEETIIQAARAVAMIAP